MSYEELLEIMKIKYFEICGHHVVGASETGIRLQVIADAIVKVKDKLILEQLETTNNNITMLAMILLIILLFNFIMRCFK